MLASAIVTLFLMGYIAMPVALENPTQRSDKPAVSLESTPTGGFWKYRDEWVDEKPTDPPRRRPEDVRQSTTAIPRP